MALVFILPALIGFLVFYLYPFIRGLYFSLTKYNLLGTPKFIGIDNFTRLFSDKLFWNALLVTSSTCDQHRLADDLAVGIADADAPADQVHRRSAAVILLPFLISNVIAAMLWFWLLDYQIGLVNQFIAFLGLDRVAFFGDARLGDPDDRLRQRLAAHGLHRAAGLRRSADDPELRVRGGVGRRQHRVELVLADHPAAAPADPRAGAGDHGDRLVPGVRHRRRDDQGRAGQRDAG